MDSIVEVNEVTKAFGKTVAVDQLSFTVPTGSIYGFIGPNGSGKTTTLRMIMNIFRPDRGVIRLFGDGDAADYADRIGYLPEERGLYKKMKVRELLLYYGELRAGRKVKAEVDHWLERLDLCDWADMKVETLSKGMSQKVQFIASVVPQPRLLILDEPFAGLDPVNADVLRNAVLELQRQDTTVIFSTHDMTVAEQMCDFILMIFRGRKVLDGTLAAIKAKYGQDTIRIGCRDGTGALAGLEKVDKITDYGRIQELRMAKGADPQAILAAIIKRTRVDRFEVATPSLHDIFVRIAGPEAEHNESG